MTKKPKPKPIVCKAEPEEPKFRHCDTYITDFQAPMCLRWFLFLHRLPAVDLQLCEQHGVVRPPLYADFEGVTYRVTMASRFGDVGISPNLDADCGYKLRVPVEKLTNFRDRP